jgi:NAD(P)-dependent dehydrogenase (short-subunit alcohol dehydrogenase family)
MATEFSGKVVIVTGADSGLGRAASLCFAAEGACVCIAGRSVEKLEETKRQMGDIGERCLIFTAELGEADICAELINAVTTAFGKIDVLCNVAAEVMMHPLADVSSEQWHRMVDSNVSAPLFLIQAAMPHLLKTKGNVVNVASTGSVMGQAYLAPYTATKFALVGLTKSLAMEFINQPVRINALAPGPMSSELAQNFDIPEVVDPDLMSRYTGIRKPATPEEVAELLVFLASEKASAIHGACYLIDNGLTAG